ncbi:MAG: sulfotransferase domain-containing protein, partial [Geminicoccales bacterium]
PGLPAFIIIGAMKSGTSSLHHYLRQHPEICMSSAKEPNFFIEARNFGKGLDWYRSLFADHTKVCGEASPAYSKRHRHRGVPERLHRLVPHIKLIYILRDPVDRMISHYLHNRILGRETRSLIAAIAAKAYRNNYVRTSMYRFQLEAFLEHFPLERILLVTAEDLKDKRTEALERIFRFIGVDPYFEGSDFGRLFNQTQAMGGAELGGGDGSAIGVSRAGQGPDAPERPALDREDRERLAAYLAPDIDGLRALTGLRFERWCL